MRAPANEKAEQAAKTRGVDIALELTRLHDWAKSNGTRKVDWDATWRNWIRPRASNGQRYSGNSNPGQVALDALARIQAEEPKP